MSNEISKCPFCGNDKQHIGSNGVGSFWVCCEDGCGCEGPYRQSEAEAVEAWNTRAVLTAAPASADVMPTIEDCHKMAAQVGMRFVPYTLSEPTPASAAEPVKVKPLAWRVFCGNSGSVEAEAFGDQYVIQNESEIWCLYRPYQDTPASHHGALHDAKAAAQSDFESRIRLAIDT